MDQSLVLVLLAAIVAIDSVALLTLLVLTVRWHRAAPTSRPPDQPSARAAALPGVPGSVEVPRPGIDDPLADAISAFLGRSDGIFRAGGRAGQAPASETPETRLASGAQAASFTSPAAGPPAVLERAGSEVTWAPSRPTRYVPSGPRPGPSTPRTTAPQPSSPHASPGPVGPISPTDRLGRSPGPQLHMTTPPPASPRSPAPRASLLAVALVARDPSGSDAAEAVARLGPVIGGLLRERTRVDDTVAPEAPGRFVVILPDTPLAGAQALADRLVASCDAWLAAELPPLRLALQAAGHDGPVPPPTRDRGRAEGPDRRRPILQDA